MLSLLFALAVQQQLTPARTNWWLAGGDTVGFFTYQTANAWNIVLAQMVGSGFQGAGHSEGAGIGDIDVPDEYVIARRIGPADVRRCPPATGNR